MKLEVVIRGIRLRENQKQQNINCTSGAAGSIKEPIVEMMNSKESFQILRSVVNQLRGVYSLRKQNEQQEYAGNDFIFI